jgi:hypothetical protein
MGCLIPGKVNVKFLLMHLANNTRKIFWKALAYAITLEELRLARRGAGWCWQKQGKTSKERYLCERR